MILNTDHINSEIKSIDDINRNTKGIILVKDSDKLLGYITWNSYLYTFAGNSDCFPTSSWSDTLSTDCSDTNLPTLIKKVKRYLGDYVKFDFLPIESRANSVTRNFKSVCCKFCCNG